MGCGMRRAAGGGRGPWTGKKTAGPRTGEGVHDARVERGSAALDELHEAFGGLGARALARRGPALSLDPAVAVHPALGAAPGGGTHQGQLPAVCRAPIGGGPGQAFTPGQLRANRPEPRPLAAEPVAAGPATPLAARTRPAHRAAGTRP